MFDEMFDVFVYTRKEGKIDEVELQGVWRVIGEKGMEEFTDEMFNYVCDGYVVEVEKYNNR